jgi:uncharacterized SAM-binding protein YcdF (DUF218 family)
VVWTSCAPDPLPWFQLREPLLHLLNTPWLLLPALAVLSLGIAAVLRIGLIRASLITTTLVLLVSGLYSPLATKLLTAWLTAQLPPSDLTRSAPTKQAPVVVLVGRGEQIAAGTTAVASLIVRDQPVAAVYVSGDNPSTARALIRQGVPSQLVSGDSCARTTWENATITAAWIRQQHLLKPQADAQLPPVVLITDPWQLPRAAQAFSHQGLVVHPIGVAPPLTPQQRNRLALRETAATILYWLQARM